MADVVPTRLTFAFDLLHRPTAAALKQALIGLMAGLPPQILKRLPVAAMKQRRQCGHGLCACSTIQSRMRAPCVSGSVVWRCSGAISNCLGALITL